MQLIEAYSIPTPADAERLVADLWQLTSGRSIGLYIFGIRGERVMLGVHAPQQYLEDIAAQTIADHCGGTVEPGWLISEMVDIADEISVVNMVPTERNLAIDSQTFGWQRSDPLRSAYSALSNINSQTIAGIGITLNAMPKLQFVTSLSAFAIGPNPGLTTIRLGSSFGGIGVRLRRPFRQRRALQRILDAKLRRPATVSRVEVVALYWHPPYGQDVAAMGVPQRQQQPLGLLQPPQY